MATQPHCTTEEQTAALGNVRRKPMQIDMLSGELVARKPKAGGGAHIKMKALGTERPAVPGMASWAGGGPEGKRCSDCAHLGAVTVRRPNTDVERAAVACLRFVQRVGRLPAVRSDIANCLSCDQFAEGSGVRAYFVNLDGVTQTTDWVDHRGVGRFLALGEKEDPTRPGHLAPPPRRLRAVDDPPHSLPGGYPMSDDFKTLAAQLRDLQDATKAQIAGVLGRAEEAGLDPAGLRRFVSWKRKDEAKRAQQEAIDQQCRYLAGEREAPAQLPIGCELAVALNLYHRQMTVRQVAEEMGVSVGKAGKLRQMSRMFDIDVHVHATVDKLPPHDPATGEVIELAAPSIMPRPDVWHVITAARDAIEAERKAARDAERERRRAAHAAWVAKNAEIDADPLTLPPALAALAEKRREIDARRRATA